MEVSEFVDKFKAYAPHEDQALLEKAFEFSKAAHAPQHRASGENYFAHCAAVAETLLEYKLDIQTVAAGLLHDVLEDTPITAEALKKEFGAEILHLVEGVTKVDALQFKSRDEAQAENWRKMILATAQDIRVILIKLADRLHNMRTIHYLQPDQRQRIADETLQLYAPLAQRLGMFELKSELEDMAFAVLKAAEYAELKVKMEATTPNREAAFAAFTKTLDEKVKDLDISYRILTRQKSLYSLYGKMQRQNKPFEEIQDILATRLITDTVANCYALVGVIHSAFKPIAGSFTDYIALPKMNLYRSLHTTVMGPTGDLIEVQIRTEEMHRTSEYGIAAHWRYKSQGTAEGGKDVHLEEKLNWLRQWIEWLQDLKSPREFLESLKTDLELHQVFVFTPKGEVKALPAGSTPIDFAFAIHTDIGHACVGARVNNKMVKLDYSFKSGDICEIQTRKGSHPKKDWVTIARTGRARSKIRKYLREKDIEERKRLERK